MTDHSLLTAVRRSWNKITDLRVGVQQATVSGSGLDLAELVAIARCVPEPPYLFARQLSVLQIQSYAPAQHR